MKKGAGSPKKGRSPSKRSPKKQGAKKALDEEEDQAPQNQQPESEDQPLRPIYKAMVFLGVLLVLSLFGLLNWLVFKFIAIFFGSSLSKLMVFLMYYFAMRAAVRYFAFPGSFQISRRQLEFQYG